MTVAEKKECSVKPLFSNVVIKLKKIQQVTAGGVALPQTVRRKIQVMPVVAEVVAVGQGEEDENGVKQALDIVPGDTVFLADQNRSLVEFMHEGEKLKIATEVDILARPMTKEELAAEEPLVDDFQSLGTIGIKDLEGLNAFVHIVRDKPPERSAGGIWYPDEAVDVRYNTDSGYVAVQGPGSYSRHGELRKMNCQAGDKIRYHKFGGYCSQLPSGEEIWCFEDREIFGIEDKGSPIGIKPLSNHVIMKKLADEEKSAGGIIIPKTAKRKEEKSQAGEIVAVGPGKFNEKGERLPMQSQVGAIAFFRKGAGNEAEIDGVKYVIVPENELELLWFKDEKK